MKISLKKIKITQTIAFPFYKLLGKMLLVSSSKPKALEMNGNHIFISNHIHGIDPFLIISCFGFSEIYSGKPITVMTSARFINIPVVGIVLRLLGCYPSKNTSKARGGIEASIKNLRDSNLLIFPQGKVVKNFSRPRVKSGVSVIASESNPSVTPIFIGKPKFLLFRARIIFGPSFNPQDMSAQDITQKVWDLEQK